MKMLSPPNNPHISIVYDHEIDLDFDEEASEEEKADLRRTS